jgi:autotransporter-associated beta strand protein
MKPNYRNSLLRASQLAHVVVGATVLNTSAIAGDVFWSGTTDSDWNNTDNWNAGRVPSKAFDFDNAIINTLTNFPVITTDLSATPSDIKVGTGGGSIGRVDHHSGLASAGDGNWSVIGEFGGNGTYNLADTSASGGTLTGFATGSGSYSTQRLYVSREGTGAMAVNTSGSVKVFNDMYVGQGGTGMLNWDAGTLNRNGDGGWMVIGSDGGGNDGDGTFNVGGGTINAANDTIVGLNSGSTGLLNHTGGSYNAGGMWIGRDGGTGTWTVDGASSQLTSTGEVYVGGNGGSNGTFQINAGTVAVNNWFNIGRDGGNGDFQMSGGSLSVDRELRIGYGVGGIGTMSLSGGAQITAGVVSEHIVIGGDKGNGTATVTGVGTKLSSVNELRVGNDADSVGELTVSGGVVEAGSWLGIGRNGSTGTLTINGTGEVNQGVTDSGSRLELTNNGIPSTATLNLDGGTLTTNGIISGSAGTRSVFLNGGLLKPRIDNDSFLEGMTSVAIKSGGAKIDSDAKNISINQSMIGLPGDGGLTKSGSGTLRLNGTNTYTGITSVTGGEIAGTGSITGPLQVQIGGTLAPGAPIGTFSAGNTTISGSYACEIDGSDNDRIDVTGVLDLSAVTDTLNFSLPGVGATKPVYIIASYASLTGSFDTVNNLPPGYSLAYGFNSENQIALVRPLTPYESWLETHFPGESDPAIIGATSDPDGDSQPNHFEFALGGDPNDSGNNAKVYQLTEDSSDLGTAKELLMTIAVRDGGDGVGMNPSFTPNGSQDGVTYTFQGGDDLTFAGSVSVVDTVATGLPPAPAGYEYRTFSLDGSDGLPAAGFMRVRLEQ